MSDRSDHTPWPPNPGPWPEVSDMQQIFDHGAWWCISADGHPGPDDDYPDPDLHVPPFECRSEALWLDSVRDDTDSQVRAVQILAATPYRFGQTRTTERRGEPRIVFECLDAADRPIGRFSIPLGDSLRLATYIEALVALIDRTRKNGIGG